MNSLCQWYNLACASTRFIFNNMKGYMWKSDWGNRTNAFDSCMSIILKIDKIQFLLVFDLYNYWNFVIWWKRAELCEKWKDCRGPIIWMIESVEWSSLRRIRFKLQQASFHILDLSLHSSNLIFKNPNISEKTYFIFARNIFLL